MRAEARFTASESKDKQFVQEKEQALRKSAEHIAKLRALRLAKEAADKESAEVAAAEKATPKRKARPRLPKAHRTHL
jgi:hypothetical protein